MPPLQQRSYLKFKAGVIVPKVCVIAAAAINAANELGFIVDITVTSGNDSTHLPNSKHYLNLALDFRTKTMTYSEKHEWIKVVKRRLGAGYDVILESEGLMQEHCHIEFDPD